MDKHDLWLICPPLAIAVAGALMAVFGEPGWGCLLTLAGIFLFTWIISRNSSVNT